MANEYSLDVAFSTETSAVDLQEPIAMAYGFVSALVGGIWTGDGQKAEVVQAGSEFYFAVFDTAATPGSVSQIEVDFETGPGRFTPLLDPSTDPPTPILNPLVAKGSGLQQIGLSEPSPGCNLIGAKWLAGPYTLTNKNGGYECTVTVSADDASNNSMLFGVDPEVLVEGGT